MLLHRCVPKISCVVSQHTSGELAILTFAWMDVTVEFDMTHPPDVMK